MASAQESSLLKKHEYFVFPDPLHAPLMLQELEETPWHVGMQRVTGVEHGAHTGALTIASAHELGMRSVLINHQEHGPLSKDALCALLSGCHAHGMVPVICMGEQYKKEGRLVLSFYQKSFIKLVCQHMQGKRFIIAFEPYWAIGGEEIAPVEYIAAILDQIRQEIESSGSEHRYSLLYGGSVDESTLPQILHETPAQGVLVGRASTDFKRIENMLSF